MGDPRRQQKHYVIPKRPFDSDRFESELQLIGTYGLRNKKELWIHRTKLSDYRRQARNILALPPEERQEPTRELIKKLRRLGFLSGDATLDTVLDLTVEDLLERRLQTIVFKKGMASSLHHARQLVAHGHIALNRARVMTPSRIINTSEQEQIEYAPGSPLTDESHPARVAAAETAEMMAESGGPSRNRYNEPGQPD